MAEDNGRLLSCASPEDPKFKAYVQDMGDGPSNPYRGINELTKVRHGSAGQRAQPSPEPVTGIPRQPVLPRADDGRRLRLG